MAVTPAPSTAVTVADEILAAAGVAAPFIPNPLVSAGIILAAQYGPGIINQIVALLSNPESTLSDVQNLFSGLKPYSAFGIPDVAPPPAGSTVVTTVTTTPAKPAAP